MSMREKVEELERRRAEARKMGGEARLARQKERGKLDARARLALTQTTRGALPCFGGSQRLARLVGAGNALKMLLTGERLDGREAMRVGLVGYLAGSRRGLMRCAQEITEAILSRGPLAMRLAKEAVLKGFDMTLGQGIRLEEDLYALLQTTADRAEGVRAFMERRRPLFKGI